MHRKLMGIVMAILAGCGATTGTAQPGSQTAEALLQGHCPDRYTDCTHSNGTGVYIAEGGRVGLGPTQFMITRFINNGLRGRAGTVTFQGRYYDEAHRQWLRLDRPGEITAASLNGKPVRVLSVEERLTTPAWRVIEDAEIVTLSGDRMVGLRLEIAFDVSHPEPATYEYELEFYEPGVVSGSRIGNVVHAYGMRWRPPTSRAFTPYCFAPDASDRLQPDPIVFQQGMSVEPVTGSVTRNADTEFVVTVSCAGGALATVYRWGYQYRAPGLTGYFDGAIQMKRASYCADERTFTRAGTEIQIFDDMHIINEPQDHPEAWWTRTGALCVNPENLRHSELARDFTYQCQDPVTLAIRELGPCPPENPPAHYIIAGPVQPGP